jgi:hypothetical protein
VGINLKVRKTKKQEGKENYTIKRLVDKSTGEMEEREM